MTATAPSPLLAFQAELARQLAAAPEHAPATGAQGIGLMLHGVRAWVPLAQVGEVVAPLPLQRVPRTQPWVLGVAALRGGVTLVVDWVRWLGLASASAPLALPAAAGYWLALAPGLGVPAALRVERLLGLHTLDGWQPVQPAPQAHAALPQVWRDGAGAVWHQLDLQRLAQAPGFLNPHQLPDPRNADV